MTSFSIPGRSRRASRPNVDQQRFARGIRSVADLIAPAAVEVARDHLRLDTQFARTLVVTGYPRTVSPGWLAPLIDFEEPIELSLHLHPLQTAQMVSTLSHKLVQLHSSRLLAARGGRLPDPEREIAYEDAERLRDALQRGEEKIFSVALYVLLRAGSLAALDALTRKVELTLGGMLAHARTAVLEQDTAFQSCLPQGQDQLLLYRNLDTSSVATMFPFSSSSLTMERGVLYGIARHNHSPVIVDPFDESLENANMVVFAASGAGKSYFTKLMALRNLLLGVDFLVIDPEDEYRALCTAVDGQYVRLASSSAQHLNPFDLPPADQDQEARDPLAEQVAALLALLEIMLAEPGHGLTSHERALLDRAIYATYAAAGITNEVSTQHGPAPLMRDLHTVLADTPGEMAMSLAARLQRYVEGSLSGLFSAPTNVALDRRLVVFNIQALEPELRPLGVHLIATFVWNQVR
ncbi:MAG: ATP-binding protein, partial [Chloroflexota bacterium]|nr:ATP-binding protein [Chloroflexota bacterium]